MKNQVLPIVLLVFQQISLAQNLDFKWHGNRQNIEHFAKSIARTSDGGIVIAGKNSPSPEHRFDALLIKIDSGGNEIWRKNYGSDDNGEVAEVLILPDGGIIFCGWSESAVEQRSVGFVQKVDAVGEVIWRFELKKYDFEQIACLAAAADGSILFAGHYFSETESWSAFFGKLNAVGQLVHHFESPFSDIGQRAMHIFDSPDGQVFLQSHKKNTSLSILEKIDWQGHLQWESRFEARVNWENYEPKVDCFALNDGTIALSALLLDARGYVKWLDSDGTLLRFDTLPSDRVHTFRTFERGTGGQMEIFATENTGSNFYRWLWSPETGFGLGQPLAGQWSSFFADNSGLFRISEDRFLSSMSVENVSGGTQSLTLFQLNPLSHLGQAEILIQFNAGKTSSNEHIVAKTTSSVGKTMLLVSPTDASDDWGSRAVFNNLSLWIADVSGEVLIKNEYFLCGSIFDWVQVAGFEAMPDGGVAVLLIKPLLSKAEAFLLKFDSKAKLILNQKLDLPENPDDFESLIARTNGGFAIPIRNSSISGERKGIYLLDSEGNFVGLRRIGWSSDAISDVVAAHDGTLAAFGNGLVSIENSNFLLLRTDGHIAEAKRTETLPSPGNEVRLTAGGGQLLPTSDGGFLGVAPNAWFFNGFYSLIKFDKNDRMQWTSSIRVADFVKRFSISEVGGRGFILEEFSATNDDSQPLSFVESYSKISLHFIDYQGKISEPNLISLYPKIEQSNPDFLKNYVWQGWADGLNLATRDLIFIRAETSRDASNLPAAATLAIAPNPSDGQLSFQLASDFVGEVEVEIFSEIGQLVWRTRHWKSGEVFHFGEFDSRLSSGVYFVRVRAGEEDFVARWVKN